VEIEKDSQEIYGTQSLGNDAIIDWVHPRVETNYYIARSMFYAIRPAMERIAGAQKNPIPAFQTVLDAAHPHAEVLRANGLVEGGFVNLSVSGPDTAKKLFLEGLSNTPSKEYETKALIGLSVIALREKDAKTLSAMIVSLKKINRNILSTNLYHYRGFKEIKEIESFLKVDGQSTDT